MSLSDLNVLNEFESKSRWLELGKFFDFTEVYLSEFVELIFNRPDLSGLGEVCPFEEKMSPEYRHWLMEQRRLASCTDGSPSDSQSSDLTVVSVDYSKYRMWRYNPIVFYKEGKKNVHQLLLKEDEEGWTKIEGRQFAIMSPVSYVGRSCSYSNARYLYAFGIDLDGIDTNDLANSVWQMYSGQCAVANIIVNSGHGVHVYFLLEKPVPMYEANIKLLNKLKAGLTRRVWNVSRDDHPQYQSVVQSFRLPGTLTKFGKPIRAFWNKDAKMHTLEELNKFVGSDMELSSDELAQLVGDAPYNPSRVTLREAKDRWPEWYASRVIGHQRVSKTWKLHRGLYDWWLNILRNGSQVTIHHRYWCILTLVVYAVKAGVPREEVLKDGLSLVPLFDTKTQTEDNHFTEGDVHDAMRAYDANYNTWPIKTIEDTTAIRIERNRRNGRTAKQHLVRARFSRDMSSEEQGKKSWREGNGRKEGSVVTADDSRCAAIVKNWIANNPTKGDKILCAREIGLSIPTVRKWWVSDDSRCAVIVKAWRRNNPDNTNKSQCARETGLTRPTVRKWWDTTN